MALGVIDISGKQFSVQDGECFWADRLQYNEGDVFLIRRVVLLVDNDDFRLGQPFDETAGVVVRVQEHARDKKIFVFKKKRRQGYKRLKGFRADQTRLEILGFVGNLNAEQSKVCEVGTVSAALDNKVFGTEAKSDASKTKAPAKKSAAPKEDAPKDTTKKATVKKEAKPAAKKTSSAAKTEGAAKKPSAKKE